MAGEDRPVHPRESDTPTRRRFLEAAGIAAAGAALANPSTSSSANADQVTPAEKTTARRAMGHNRNPRPTCVAVTATTSDKRQRAVTCDDTGKTILWDITDASKVAKITVFPNRISGKASYVAVSKPPQAGDGTLSGIVLTAGFDGHVLVHDLAKTSQPARDFVDHATAGGPGTEVWAVAVTSDGKYAISGTNGGEIRIWNPIDSALASIAESATDEPVASLAFLTTTDGSVKFLAGYGEGKMERWTYSKDTGSLQRDNVKFDHENASTVNSIAVSNNTAITGSLDSNLRSWNVATSVTGNQTSTPEKRRHAHFIWRVAISLNGTVASVGEDGQLLVVDSAGNPKTHGHKKGKGIMGLDFVDDTHVIITKEFIDPFADGAEVDVLLLS